MGILFMTGDHPRHSYIARCIAKSNLLSGMIIERREAFVPEPPAGLNDHTRDLFAKHFAGRASSEARFFSNNNLPQGIETLVVDPSSDPSALNSPQVWNFIERIRPDLLLSYGVHKLSEETLARAQGRRWNIHGGLSPWYRGAITHFWPSYFLEPQMTGMTVHTLTQAIDGGEIIHQAAAELVKGDGIHDLACRAVMQLGQELPELVASGVHGTFNPPTVQSTTGRIWRSADWRPEHLHLIYDVYSNRIVDAYLDGKFTKRDAKLMRGVRPGRG
jgi:folate-dependent phosphoribosylglycinamide formyltransferase PurN